MNGRVFYAVILSVAFLCASLACAQDQDSTIVSIQFHPIYSASGLASDALQLKVGVEVGKPTWLDRLLPHGSLHLVLHHYSGPDPADEGLPGAGGVYGWLAFSEKLESYTGLLLGVKQYYGKTRRNFNGLWTEGLLGLYTAECEGERLAANALQVAFGYKFRALDRLELEPMFEFGVVRSSDWVWGFSGDIGIVTGYRVATY